MAYEFDMTNFSDEAQFMLNQVEASATCDGVCDPLSIILRLEERAEELGFENVYQFINYLKENEQ